MKLLFLRKNRGFVSKWCLHKQVGWCTLKVDWSVFIQHHRWGDQYKSANMQFLVVLRHQMYRLERWQQHGWLCNASEHWQDMLEDIIATNKATVPGNGTYIIHTIQFNSYNYSCNSYSLFYSYKNWPVMQVKRFSFYGNTEIHSDMRACSRGHTQSHITPLKGH